MQLLPVFLDIEHHLSYLLNRNEVHLFLCRDENIRRKSLISDRSIQKLIQIVSVWKYRVMFSGNCYRSGSFINQKVCRGDLPFSPGIKFNLFWPIKKQKMGYYLFCEKKACLLDRLFVSKLIHLFKWSKIWERRT